MPGAKHLWVGDAEKVLDEVVRRVAPDVPVPLPTTWDGPMETGRHERVRRPYGRRLRRRAGARSRWPIS